jgi:glycosyltransferase involved in cell wall biosynthesis
MAVKISIITICFNNLEEVKTTCRSVDAQVLPPFEHWIIDGSSTPEIRKYLSSTPQPAYRKWLSESDKGIGDAFNKGVQRATGDIINMLNAGDYYYDENTLSLVTNAFETNPSIQWLHGKYRLQRGGSWVIVGKPFEKSKLYRGMRSLSHQSMFIRAALHTQYGLYDTTLRNAMDYDFVCRIAAEPLLFLEQPLVTFTPGGTTYTHYRRALAEVRKVYEKYFGFSFKLVLWQERLKFLDGVLNSPVGQLLYRLKVKLGLENM